LISDLRPSHLDDLGLSSAVRWYASDIEGRTPLKVTVEIRGREREMDSGITTTVFRIIQEGLTNVIKHADAKRAQIILEYGENNFISILKDDGKGFNLPALKQAKKVTWGLKNMEERVSLFGGDFSITSEMGTGTTIFLSLPYTQSTLEAEWGSG
jgi:signal transduction histidine kinase